jgi:hypothetical protein
MNRLTLGLMFLLYSSALALMIFILRGLSWENKVPGKIINMTRNKMLLVMVDKKCLLFIPEKLGG